MGNMADAVNPANIPAEFHGGPALRITCLADPAGECFDSETGNAPVDQVATGMAVRHGQAKFSVGYTNEDNFKALSEAMTTKGLSWLGAEHWPAPGVYLWAAAPGTPAGERPAWCPVEPVAVQDRPQGDYDLSTTTANFPATAAGYIDGKISVWPAAAWADYTELGATPAPAPEPAPAPAPPQEATVLLPVLQEGAQGPSVESVQRLLGGLAVDGIFGPLTHQSVTAFQGAHGLAEDGIVGVHTWGSLLGAPQ